MEHPMTAPAPAPSATGHTKQYVFVDEYNRHKRLKVMRACDGCRKRKIRCDGALQNGPWPCGACVRLKLKCIPPTLDQDDESQTLESAPGQHQFTFQNTSFQTSNPTDVKTNGFPSQPQMSSQWTASAQPAISTTAPITAPVFQHDFDATTYEQTFHSQPAGSQLDPAFSDDDYYSSVTASRYSQGGQTPSLLRTRTAESRSSSGDPEEIDATVRELSEQMGDLQIDITSAAHYITNRQNFEEAPAMEEAEVALPPTVYTDTTVQIPPEMMPSDERAMDYFGYYFEHIHQYVPILNRAEFLEQWRTSRSSISPLLLEGIFACVARYLEPPVVAQKWLALAARHEESVKDVPRLSTIQALIVLMKARESISKRGYYYRSWMTVKYMCTMGFDLSLHQHHDQHRTSNTCSLSKSECIVRTRIWQTLFVTEILVGAPLGRTDFSIEVETVDFNLPFPSSLVDAFEHQTSRRSTMIAQNMKNIKQSNQLWQTMRRYKKDWALDPAFVRHNEDLPSWLKNLPSDFQVHYPEDGSPPWLGNDHFTAYLHIYHHLVVIMHHRPQLQALLEKRDPSFKSHLDICIISAAQMCRIQEALYRDYGFHGLQFFVRGVNFTIYCVLTCTMLHLAAITCPDPILNTQARLYFTRHMRVLEHCLTSANPEMRVQINALREAFSADTSQPFELKPSLGMRSPSMDNYSTPGSTVSAPATAPALSTQTWTQMDAASSKTMTPTSEYGGSFDSVPNHSMATRPPIPHHTSGYEIPTNGTYDPQLQVTSAPQVGYALEPAISNEQQTPIWDPSGIFAQWNTAFGGGQAPTQSSPPNTRIQPTSAPMMPNQNPPINGNNPYGTPHQIPVNHSPVLSETTPPIVPTVTPVMWQDAFTNAYVSGHGQKRYREASVDHSQYGPYANKRRA